MKSGPIQVDEKEWEYAEQFLSSSKNPWSVDLFYVCPVPSRVNSKEEIKQHEVLVKYRSANGFPFVTLNHEFIRAGDRLFAMPSAYEIEKHPQLEKRGGQGAFSWVIPRDIPTSTEWGVKKLTRSNTDQIPNEKLKLAEFATSLCVGENYPFIIRSQNNETHYYHIQLCAPGLNFSRIAGFKSALAYYLSTISLIRIVRNLHVNNIIHRDIKPQNVVQWQTNTDPFGMALIDNDPTHLFQLQAGNNLVHTNTRLGTQKYKAPECNKPTVPNFAFQYGFASDVYSLGLTLLERYGITPENQGLFTEPVAVHHWIGGVLQVYYQQRPRFKERPPEFANVWLPLENLLLQMTAHDPFYRPDLTTALRQLIIGMHEAFDANVLQNDWVKLTLEKCPPEILMEARSLLKINGISLALPAPAIEEISTEEEVDVLGVNKALVSHFNDVYKPSCKEEYVTLAVDVEKILVAPMQRCRLS